MPQRNHEFLGLLVGLRTELGDMLLELAVHAQCHVIPAHVGEVAHESAVDVFAVRVDGTGPLEGLHGAG
jgi:hypothetical protein